MMDELIKYAIALWSIFFLWNYSLILEKTKEKYGPRIPYPFSYIVQCSYCFPFWASIPIAMYKNNFIIIFVVPAISHLTDLTYRCLYKQASRKIISGLDVDIDFERGALADGIRVVQPQQEHVKVWSQSQPGGLATTNGS